jgi:hypothetical protein
MNTNAQSTNPPALVIDGIIIPVKVDPVHEYTMTTAQAAAGYEVSESTIKEHKRQHADELFAGKHFLEVRNPDFQPGKGGAHTHIHWTKRGIIRLGFFIKSERAKRFRDMAEDLVLNHWENELAPTHDLGPVLHAILDEIKALRLDVTEMRQQNLHLQFQLAAQLAQPQPAVHLPSLQSPEEKHLRKLVEWMVDNDETVCKFIELVTNARRLGLFRGQIQMDYGKDGQLHPTPQSRSSLGRILERHKGKVFTLGDGRAACFGIVGKNRQRRYFVEPLEGVLVATQ